MGAGSSRGQAPLGDSFGVGRRSCVWFAERCMYHVEDQDIRNLKIQVTLKQRSGPLDPTKDKRNSITAPAGSPAATSGMPTADPNQPGAQPPAQPGSQPGNHAFYFYFVES